MAVIDDPASGRGLDGQVVNLVGLDHCTAGTNKPVFTVHPLRITAAPVAAAVQEGAGRRKTRRRQQRNRKNKSRLVKRRRSQ